MVFYAAFNSISAKSQRQLTLFMSFLGFTSTRLGLWSVLPMDTPTKIPRGSSAARTQDPSITSQTIYHWAKWDPIKSYKKPVSLSITHKYEPIKSTYERLTPVAESSFERQKKTWKLKGFATDHTARFYYYFFSFYRALLKSKTFFVYYILFFICYSVFNYNI